MEERYGFEGMCNKRLRWGYTRRTDFIERILGRKFSRVWRNPNHKIFYKYQ